MVDMSSNNASPLADIIEMLTGERQSEQVYPEMSLDEIIEMAKAKRAVEVRLNCVAV